MELMVIQQDLALLITYDQCSVLLWISQCAREAAKPAYMMPRARVLPLLAMTISRRPDSRRSIEMTWTFCCFNNSTDLVLYVSSNHYLMRNSSSCA